MYQGCGIGMLCWLLRQVERVMPGFRPSPPHHAPQSHTFHVDGAWGRPGLFLILIAPGLVAESVRPHYIMV